MNRKLVVFASLTLVTSIYMGYQPTTRFYFESVPGLPTLFKKAFGQTEDEIETCPNGTILWTSDFGNTGNKIWEYMSVFAVAGLSPKRFHPYIPDSMIKNLEEIFEPLSLPRLSTLPDVCKNYTNRIIGFNENYSVIENLPDETKIVRLAMFSARIDDIIRFGLDKVRRELSYKQTNVKTAMDRLNELKTKFSIPSDANPVYVGMHFRGTDYTGYLKFIFKEKFIGPPTHEFYAKAMKYFTDKYEHVIFILISIDYEWIKENAPKLPGNVAVNPGNNDKVEDMALLSHCNHSIISYGTFGTSVALFAGGTTIAYDLKLEYDYDGKTLTMILYKLLSNWMVMN